jgi:predicted N-acetyltransferase YhbS
MIHIGDEAAAEAGARERLLDRAMGPDRVLKPSERLREGRLPARGLALVARDGETVIGSVRLWHIHAGEHRPALLLGPLAVDPAYQGDGIGSALMTASVGRAAALGHGAILLVGEAPYYARFGFSADLTRKLKMPAPVLRRRFLGLELERGALAGASGKVVAAGQPAITSMLEPASFRRVA